MTAAARSYSPRPITEPQRKAIFAAARQRGMSTDDVRALCPKGSVSMLSSLEASRVLDRLNGKTDDDRSRRTKRRKSGARDVTRMISSDQLAYIDKLRICMGWTKRHMGEHLDAKHYKSDPSRKMSVMQSSPDAVAVIEHLRKIATRKLHFHGVNLGMRKADEPNVKELPAMMRVLPPHDALIELFTERCGRWRTANPESDWAKWADAEAQASGRRTSCPTTCAEMARLIERMEAELFADPTLSAANEPDESDDDPPAVIAKIGGAR
ncbi:MAG: hypothetical protein HS101_15980 [Planctomycetia bacterium]|jgi:hypothetical protein|nr:hypothetical protein [Planctomycetia bacterium]MCC7315154.1 hypothetical protein [Planctomycetota bacterium]OQY96255.1 MAG: hypothetical protein B6D36_19725 [Planctomycetes bacterium UTPLA1]